MVKEPAKRAVSKSRSKLSSAGNLLVIFQLDNALNSLLMRFVKQILFCWLPAWTPLELDYLRPTLVADANRSGTVASQASLNVSSLFTNGSCWR